MHHRLVTVLWQRGNQSPSKQTLNYHQGSTISARVPTSALWWYLLLFDSCMKPEQWKLMKCQVILDHCKNHKLLFRQYLNLYLFTTVAFWNFAWKTMPSSCTQWVRRRLKSFGLDHMDNWRWSAQRTWLVWKPVQWTLGASVACFLKASMHILGSQTRHIFFPLNSLDLQWGLEIHGLKLHGPPRCTFLNWVQKYLRCKFFARFCTFFW